MKKVLFIVGLSLALAVLYVTAFGTVTESSAIPTQVGSPMLTRLTKITITQDAKADFTETVRSLYGYLDSVSIDSTGVDTSYKIYVRDEQGTLILAKTNCSSLLEPHRLAVVSTDTSGGNYMGVPVCGSMTVEMADGDDDSLSAISIHLYVREYRK